MRFLARTALAGLAMLTASAAAAAGDDGTRPGDDAMTCQQIAMELMPGVQQMRGGSTQQLGQDAQEMQRRAVKREAEIQSGAAAETAEMEAGCIGGVNATCAAASEAIQARHDARNAQIKAEDKPLNDRASSEMSALAAQGQAMQQNPRLMHLMQLAQQKHCH